MKQSHSRHNVFSKVDHDKSFIDKNYRESKNASSSELPVLQMDIRKRLASTHLSAKLSGKTAVTTVATGLGHDQNEAIFFEQFGHKDGKLYDDENASVTSNHSIELENLKKSPELLRMENFLDELGKVHVSDVEDDDDGSYDSEDSYGEFVERDRKKYTSTLDVHRKFMLKAKKKNTLSDVKTVAAMKIMTHKKKQMKDAQNQNLLSGALSNATLSSKNIDNNAASVERNTTSAVTGASTGSMLGLASAAQSFLFLSKISAGANAAPRPSGSHAASSPQLTKPKSIEGNAIPPAPAGSPGSPATYSASPGGYAYSSKHNLLHEVDSTNSPAGSPDGRLKLFGKAQRPKQIAHRTFSATTLSNLHSKFDTTHSVLSATKDHGAVVKVAHLAPAMGADSANPNEKSLYHVPVLNAGMGYCCGIFTLQQKSQLKLFYCMYSAQVHGKKTMLGQLDKLFHSLTYQAAEPIAKPEAPAPPEPMSLSTLFKDQLIHTHIPENQKISDQEFNTLMNSTTGPANYGPRKVVDHSSPAAIVAQLDKALQRQKREEEEQKRRYESIAAAHVISPHNAHHHHADNDTVDYSMATFVTRLDQLQLGQGANAVEFAQTAGTASKVNVNHPVTNNSSFTSPPKLDFSKINPPKSQAKTSVDPYSIDVHALKLPNIMSPQTEAYYQQQRQPILCIYSPAPLASDGSPSGESKHQHHASPPKSTAPGAPVGRSSPIQLQGTLTSTSHNHSSSSPAIMYISSPGLFKDTTHNKSAASLPVVSHSRAGAHSPEDNHMHHHYQTQSQYHQALHPQTQAFVSNMLSTTDPDFHTDPRNYRGGGPGSVADAFSIADIENSIYDYELEAEDLAQEPMGDRGMVSLDKGPSRILLPTNTAQQGGEALLELGYQYQHSTNTFVHKDERNRSKFGQYQRSPLGDPYAADFSDRQLQAILDTTVGHGPPVLFIPPGAPAAEPKVANSRTQGLPQLTNGSGAGAGQATAGAGVGKAAGLFGSLAQKARAKGALAPGEVMQGQNYGGVRAIMQNPGELPTNSIHYRGGASPEPDIPTPIDDGDYGDDDGNDNHGGPSNAISAGNSTLQSHHASGNDIKQEICDYIAKLASKQATHHAPLQHHYNYSSVESYATNDDIDNSTYNTHDRQAEIARVKLWDKLNNRYGGDREGEFVKKQEIKAYIYDGIKQDTQIMNDYLAEMEDGWHE